MTATEFYQELDTILERPPGTIKGDESLADLTGWDSMSALLFIDMVDSKLGLVVKAAELIKCKNVGDLINVCEGRVTG